MPDLKMTPTLKEAEETVQTNGRRKTESEKITRELIESECNNINNNNEHLFVPLAIETSGAFVPVEPFFTDLGKQVADQLEEPRTYYYLLQRVTVEVQKGDAAAILGTLS